ncbi:DUF4367 domain-containing protein [Desulfosporosinus sp. PR]|uniref:DUF4367 domain-containing protein n=1 Tax=Candidatus Desulfosporosinus nitrosoreducens TaxID=3401928 RepID=UPI0027F748C4|nr:DUF4367 domain-containing protein [Desulfosporosinus sp. PR]MDQ7092441.1 DUF4367 domain-containing protein [Desulfosporosinus sp. PR]
MSDNSSDQSREKLFEEYEDSLFRLIMHEAAEKEGKLFLEEKERLKNDPESLPSREAVQRFSRQLDAHFKKTKAYARKRRILKALNRAAVAMLIVIAVLFTAVASVQAVRVKVLNFLMNIQPQYTSFKLKESGSNSDSGKPVVNWTNTYVPTYIPEGYKVSTTTNHELVKKIIFENAQDKNSFIIYTELNEANTSEIDTENASVFKSLSINGHDGTLTVKNSTVTIIWEMDNHMFMVQAPTSESTAVKIAEGVKYIN